MRLGIAGGGRAAWAFGSAWRRIGWPIAGVWLRDESKSAIAELLETPRRTLAELADRSELLLIAVSDRAIAEVAQQVPDTNAILFHASGSLTAIRGGFSLHPLRSLPPAGIESDLKDALLVFEGNHRDIAQRIANAIGARFASIDPKQKALYHAAAVFGSNYVAAVLDIAERLMHRAGIEDVREDLTGLAGSAIRNWSSHAGGDRFAQRLRFTGPAARGDRATIEAHLAALSKDPQLASAYELLADYIRGCYDRFPVLEP
ncbi:MAG TPA: Rossmann-like and DUF2520 domain-containing protein [Thermoanaerobaculia bacterium]